VSSSALSSTVGTLRIAPSAQCVQACVAPVHDLYSPAIPDTAAKARRAAKPAHTPVRVQCFAVLGPSHWHAPGQRLPAPLRCAHPATRCEAQTTAAADAAAEAAAGPLRAALARRATAGPRRVEKKTKICAAGDLYQRVVVRLTGLARGAPPDSSDGALAALHLADLRLWLAPRAPAVRELRLQLDAGPEGRAYRGPGEEAVESAIAACRAVELVSLELAGRCAPRRAARPACSSSTALPPSLKADRGAALGSAASGQCTVDRRPRPPRGGESRARPLLRRRLRGLPISLARLGGLRELRITADNTLERLPAFLGHLTALERLYISVDIQGRCGARAGPRSAAASGHTAAAGLHRPP